MATEGNGVTALTLPSAVTCTEGDEKLTGQLVAKANFQLPGTE